MIHSISLVEPNTVNCSTSSTTGHYILATRIFTEHAAMVSRLPGEFDPDREEWSSYAERIEFYLVAQGITDADKQRAVLLSACGPTMFGLLKRIVTPGSLRDYSFERLVELAREHLNPKPSIAVLRAKFHSRRRHSGESIATFVSELKRLAEHCEFGDFDSMLRDKLVCDTGDKRIQEKLMAEAELSYENAYRIATAVELSDRSGRELEERSPAAAPNVHWVSADKSRGKNHPKPQFSPCYRCGGKHSAAKCKFKDAECFHCGKKGHIARVCGSKQREPQAGERPSRKKQHTNNLMTDQPEEQASCDDEPVYSQFQLTDRVSKPLAVQVEANGRTLDMEVDTGASLSIISEDAYLATWPENERPPLQPSRVKLRTYSGDILRAKGVITVSVTYYDQTLELSLQVLNCPGPTLLGRDWLHKLKLNWSELFTVNQVSTLTLQSVLDNHKGIFEDKLGTVNVSDVHLHVKKDATPHFYRPRSVPYSMREKIETELQRLQSQGVIDPVLSSDWAAPIVPVIKKDGTVRICGDYKVTINKELERDVYPLPRVEDLFSSLSGGTLFSKLDLAHAYQQLVLDEESRKLTTINTTKGLFRYNRLPFGVSTAPAIFQRTMENLLQSIDNVCVYLDDILVTGPSQEAHLKNLDLVLTRLETAGVKLKQQKCAFLLPEVEYLGHKITKYGLQPTAEKIRAIKEAPVPENLTQLKSFLGLVNYYAKFVSNLSSILAPLYLLLQKESPWQWGPEQQSAFDVAKEQLFSDSLLAHYDMNKDLILSCDASSYGVGAVLSHLMENGDERPVAYASRSLSSAEKRYSQLDREALALVFGVTRFRQYLLGRQFKLLTDHKPLIHLFGESRGILTMASARLQRWALTLSGYDYKIVYKSGKELCNADGLSRLPLPDYPSLQFHCLERRYCYLNVFSIPQ